MTTLLLTGATIITLDAAAGSDSPVEPLRRVVGEALGPVEAGASAVMSPVADTRDWFSSRGSLRRDVDALRLQNAELEEKARTNDFDRNRLQEYDRLTSAANEYGRAPD